MSAVTDSTRTCLDTLAIQPSTSGRHKVLVIAGPTAVGKSATALQLANRLRGEIVSADSVQVYKGLDIGSNKANLQERAAVPHHVVDVVEPSDPYSAGTFFREARNATENIIMRGNFPIVVGGTMMYVRWFIYGRPATPPPDPEVVARVESKLAAVRGDWDAGLAILAEKDPSRANALSPNDWYRLARALQVTETTGGIGVSAIPLKGGAPMSKEPTSRMDLDHDFRCVFLYTDRLELNRRIDARCEHMILPARSGMFDDEHNKFAIELCDQHRSILSEVGRLLTSRVLQDRPHGGSPCRAIGYRQTIEYLVSRAMSYADPEAFVGEDGTSQLHGADGGDYANQDALDSFRKYVDEFQQATRGYAKQQLHWFRKECCFYWVRAGPDATDEIQRLLAMSESEYQTHTETTIEDQDRIRNDMVQQGKLMKTYLPCKVVVSNGSSAEQFAVDLAERLAKDIKEKLSVNELQELFRTVHREVDSNLE